MSQDETKNDIIPITTSHGFSLGEIYGNIVQLEFSRPKLGIVYITRHPSKKTYSVRVYPYASVPHSYGLNICGRSQRTSEEFVNLDDIFVALCLHQLRDI